MRKNGRDETRSQLDSWGAKQGLRPDRPDVIDRDHAPGHRRRNHGLRDDRRRWHGNGLSHHMGGDMDKVGEIVLIRRGVVIHVVMVMMVDTDAHRLR